MTEKLLKEYVEARSILDEQFRIDFEKGFKKFKQDPKIYKTIINELDQLHLENKRNVEGSNIAKCSSCGVLFAEEELDEVTKECFYCKIFLKHDILSKK